MGLLNDKKLDSLVAASTPLVSDIRTGDFGRWDSRIQPSSIDLSIGKIHVPGAQHHDRSGEVKFFEKLLLRQGQTAVVYTAETLCLPGHVAGIGFPPSSVSMQGLLMTNPGHVDPGFQGSMSFTVINIAKEPFELKCGDLICTLLFFEMQEKAAVDYDSLDKTGRPPRLGLDGLLRILSRDFMNIDQRSEYKARKVVDEIDLETRQRQITIPVISALIAAVVTLGVAIFSPLQEIEERVLVVEQRLDPEDVKRSLSELRQKIISIENKIDSETGSR